MNILQKFSICFLIITVPLTVLGSPKKMSVQSFDDKLLQAFSKNYSSQKMLDKLKAETLAASGKSVPALIQIMKNSKYPLNNRWIATFLLGRIAGKKASPFISKFVNHPNWMMRVAGLKTLLHLKDKSFANLYGESLQDKSLIVRSQALENIKDLNLKEQSAKVWSMIFDKQNYHSTKKGFKRTNIINKVIRVVGDLKFIDAKNAMLSMVVNGKYQDLFEDLDYSLEKITGQTSPANGREAKIQFWKKMLNSSKTI